MEVTQRFRSRWKRPAVILLLGVVLLLVALWLPVWLYQRPSSVQLRELVHRFAADTNVVVDTLRLSPEWVGTVTRVHLRDPDKIHESHEPEHIRFSHAWSRFGRLTIARMRGNRFLGSEAAEYRETLPTVSDIAKCRFVEELEAWFGRSRAFTDAWGSENRMHFTVGWVFFTLDGEHQIRYLRVFAHVSQAQGAQKTDIDILGVYEGRFEPAWSFFSTEFDKFETGEQLAIEEARLEEKEIRTYREPLQGLVRAYLQSDSDLAGYETFVGKFRREVNPELLQQLVGHIHNDTVRFGRHLEALLLEYPNQAWQPRKKQKALAVLVDSLELAKDQWALQTVIEAILKAVGGGKIDVTDPATGEELLIEVIINPDGHSTTLDGFGYSQKLIQEAQVALRELLKAKLVG